MRELDLEEVIAVSGGAYDEALYLSFVADAEGFGSTEGYNDGRSNGEELMNAELEFFIAMDANEAAAAGAAGKSGGKEGWASWLRKNLHLNIKVDLKGNFSIDWNKPFLPNENGTTSGPGYQGRGIIVCKPPTHYVGAQITIKQANGTFEPVPGCVPN